MKGCKSNMTKLIKLRNVLEEKELDGILITNPYNRHYLSEFTGSSGNLLVTKEKALLITDFRYIEQANDQTEDFEVVEHTGPILLEIKNQLHKYSIKRLAFEENEVTYKEYTDYKKTLEVDLVPTSEIVEEIRIIKTSAEIEIMQKAANIADNAFTKILDFIKPGVKEIDVSNELERLMRAEGATSSSFDIIVASGYRGALPHGVASEKEIQSGELVTMDFGALYKGYCSDITRTVAVGEINEELKNIYDTVLQAQLLGVKGVKQGMTGKEADALTRDYITEKGYGKYFGHSTGHGLGLEVHENPRLASSSETVLQENMVVTVEPGIYVPNVGGCRIEDDLIVTANGNKRLTHSNKELIIL